MSRQKLKPKLITVLKEGYSFQKFVPDLIAGIIVGIVALPLAIAFAIASGVKPEQGLYTAVVAGFLVSCFSGSRVQIGGPTGAFIVIVYGIVQQYGYDGLAIATLMAGVMLILMGLARFGDVIKYIPYPVTVGFTAGIALIIFTSQIRDLFGLRVTLAMPAEFIEKIQYYAEHIGTLNLYAILFGLATIVIIVYFPRITKKVPGSFIAIIVTTILVKMLNIPIETIGSRFGGVPNSLPVPHFPHIDLSLLSSLISPAMTIALLAGIESLLSAVVADGMTGNRHRSNMELIAQGIANIVSPIMGGIPATGAIARTATNIKSGGKTPFAGIVHAITLLLILIFFGKWAALIPMATLAGILVVVSYNMSEWRLFVKIFKSPKSDVLVLLTTFLLTVFVDLTVAIKFGIVLAALLFMRRMSEKTQVGYITSSIAEQATDEDDVIDEYRIKQKDIPSGVEVFEINGPLFFGAADKCRDTLRGLEKKIKVLILRLRYVPTIDATGLSALENMFTSAERDGTEIILSGVQPSLFEKIKRAGLIKYIKNENIQPTINHALECARKILKGEKFIMELTMRDVVKAFAVPEKTVNNWIGKKGMPCVKTNEQYRFNYIELLDWALTNKITLTSNILAFGEVSDSGDNVVYQALRNGNIHYDVPGDNKEQVLKNIVDLLELPPNLNRESLFDLLQAREEIMSTAIGNGIAIPHVRNPVVLHIEQPSITLCFLKNPIDFKAIDKNPVFVLFTILTPSVKTHLLLLSRLAFCLQNEKLQEYLQMKAAPEQIFAEIILLESQLAAAKKENGKG